MSRFPEGDDRRPAANRKSAVRQREESEDTGTNGDGRLFASEANERFRSRWSEIQTKFVDDPRLAVEQADALVGEMTDNIVSLFARNRDELERQWTAGEDVSTEDLRRTLQQYRTFFQRLLSL